jgi:hypothetical protein
MTKVENQLVRRVVLLLSALFLVLGGHDARVVAAHVQANNDVIDAEVVLQDHQGRRQGQEQEADEPQDGEVGADFKKDKTTSCSAAAQPFSYVSVVYSPPASILQLHDANVNAVANIPLGNIFANGVATDGFLIYYLSGIDRNVFVTDFNGMAIRSFSTGDIPNPLGKDSANARVLLS